MKDPRSTIQDNLGDALITAMAAYSTPAARVVTNPNIDTPNEYVQLDESPTLEAWPTRHERWCSIDISSDRIRSDADSCAGFSCHHHDDARASDDAPVAHCTT